MRWIPCRLRRRNPSVLSAAPHNADRQKCAAVKRRAVLRYCTWRTCFAAPPPPPSRHGSTDAYLPDGYCLVSEAAGREYWNINRISMRRKVRREAAERQNRQNSVTAARRGPASPQNFGPWRLYDRQPFRIDYAPRRISIEPHYSSLSPALSAPFPRLSISNRIF